MKFVHELITISRRDSEEMLHRYMHKTGLNLYHHKASYALLGTQSYHHFCLHLLKLPPKYVYQFIENPPYKKHEINKRSGGIRKISAPFPFFKNILRKLNYYLQGYYLTIKPPHVHGFVINPSFLAQKCNILENAKLHANKKHILNLDLKDFFPSITTARVKQLFESALFQFDSNLSTALTLLVTYEGKLPTGAPTSPAISNFICFEMDYQMHAFAKDHQLTYSRYADDLAFSSDSYISEEIIKAIEEIIEQQNFKINPQKKRVIASGRRQTITGLTVNSGPNVPRPLLKKIRAMLHDLETNGLESAAARHFKIQGEVHESQIQTFIYRLNGYISFVGQIRGKEDKQYKKMKNKFSNYFSPPQEKILFEEDDPFFKFLMH